MARAGDTASQIALATKYRDGIGVRKSDAKALWWYERLAFIDPCVDGNPNYLVANYARICEELMFGMMPPFKKFIMKRIRAIASKMAEYCYFKEPDYILGCIWRSLLKFGKELLSTLGELMFEIAMVVIPVLIVFLITLLFSYL